MAGDEVRVDPDDLRAKAAQIEAISWSGNPAGVPAVPADGLETALTAVRNLNQNATTLAEYQEYGKKQGQRLAETLRLVADAYEIADQNAMDSINNSMPGQIPPPPAPVLPGSNTTPAPTPPLPNPTPKGIVTEPYLEVKVAQGSLMGGDQAASLQAAATAWSTNATMLATTAQNFELSSVNWEGEAADSAYRSFNDYRAFLIDLSGAWERMVGEAERVAKAHFDTLAEHTPIAEEYAQLEAQLPAAIANGGSAARVIQLKMEKLQNESEEIRHEYTRQAQPQEVNAPEPPSNTGSPKIPVRRNGDPRKPAGQQDQQGLGGGAGQQGGSGGGQQAAPSAPQDAPVSPMSAADQAPQGGQGGGQQGGGQGGQQGGSQGGGQQGGGQQGGGSPGGGMPGGGKGDPKLPTDPSLRPAAAGGGGSGGGAGGGGGGGMPSSPLQPAVGAETVAPTPFAAPTAPAAAAGGAAGGGATGGGMGGMAPMHGAQGGGSTEKKRNPQLSQDEDLYTEDRPWTEAVIGNRVRRRGAPDESKKESQ